MELKIQNYLHSQTLLKLHNSKGNVIEINIRTKDYTSNISWDRMPEINVDTVIRPSKSNFGTWDFIVVKPSEKRGNYNF